MVIKNLSKSSVTADFGIAFVYKKSGKDVKKMLGTMFCPGNKHVIIATKKCVINGPLIAYFRNGLGYGRFEKDAKKIEIFVDLQYILP